MEQGVSLKDHNTFGLQIYSVRLIIARSIERMKEAWNKSIERREQFLVIGEGGNVLFLEDFSGTVIVNQLKGIEVVEDDDSWHLHVGSGENWHDLVSYTLDHGMFGLENLALIPGLVGSAPIQNIGAYGVELKDFCSYVEVLVLQTGALKRFSVTECEFRYRDSIFKHRYQKGYIIVKVGLRLPKKWEPKLTYSELVKLDAKSVTPHQVYETVCNIRHSKLPDPKVTGNAGSFFKNPTVDGNKFAELMAIYPKMPYFSQKNGLFKLAAGWLIDRCSLKGYKIGGATVHDQQALVLVNFNNAVSQDVVNLARHVRNTVGKTFGIWLEPEVRFIGRMGEVDAIELLSRNSDC